LHKTPSSISESTRSSIIGPALAVLTTRRPALIAGRGMGAGCRRDDRGRETGPKEEERGRQREGAKAKPENIKISIHRSKISN
jgi:hypothetical protein